MKNERVKIAIIGAGRWGKNHVKTAYNLGVLSAVIESNSELQTTLKETYPGIKIFKSIEDEGALDFDAYIIAAPAEFHYTLAKTCILAKKHVLIEKPITLCSNEAQELCVLAKDQKVVIMTGHLLVFHPAINKIKEAIDSGKIGKLQYIYSNRLNLGAVRKEENSMWNFAPHDLSIFQFLIGHPPIAIESHGATFLQPGIHDSTVTYLTYPNNVMVHNYVSWLHPFKEHRVVVIGDKGMFSFEDSHPEKPLYFYEKGIDFVNGEPVERNGETYRVEYEKNMPLTEEHKHFIACIEGREQNNLISGQHGVDSLKVLEIAQRCLEDQDAKFKPLSLEKKYFAHETADISENASIGEATKIWHHGNIQKNANIGQGCILGQNVNIANNVKIGNFCKIQNNVSVYEGVELEDYVFCGPSMVFTNINLPRSKYPQAESKYYIKTLVREGSSIGANATIVCGVTLGRFSVIGAGSVVTKDVPDYALVVGNPAKIVGWVSEGGKKMNFEKEKNVYCEKSGKTYALENNSVVELKNKKVKL